MMDAGWIKALELPTKITGGVFAACIVIGYSSKLGFINLDTLGAWVPPLVFLVGILSGCLFVASIVASAWDGFTTRRTKQAEKQAKQEADQEAQKAQEARRQAAIAHLDHLSEMEIYMVAKALNEGSPSFTSWGYASGAAQLVDKGLLIKHLGTFNTDHWPYTFQDFAWPEILNRKDYFLQREKELELKRNKRR